MGSAIKEALAQIRQIKATILERQRFHGYSGIARILSGFMALLTAMIMAMPFYPHTIRANLMGWGAVFVAALLCNGVALAYWFLRDPRVQGNVRRLKPLLDSLPPLAVGGVLTVALIVRGDYQYLFGVWMCMFGLSNIASHYVVPQWITLVGVFYVVCGTAWLAAPQADFLNPLPMGLVFFAGEWAGGLALHFDRRRTAAQIKTLDELHASEQPAAHPGETFVP